MFVPPGMAIVYTNFRGITPTTSAMTAPFSPDVERPLLADLYRLAAEREAAERQVQAEFAARNAAAEKEFATDRQRAAAKVQSDLDATQRDFDQALDSAKREYEEQHSTTAAESADARDRVNEKYSAREEETNKQLDQDTWQASTVFEASHPGLLEQLNRVEARVVSNAESLNAVVNQTLQYLDLCRQMHAWEQLPIEDRPIAAGDPFKHLPDCATAASMS